MEQGVSSRFIDYFAICGWKDKLRPVEFPRPYQGPFDIGFKGHVISRYPVEDHEDSPFNQTLHMFTFPHGLRLRRTPTEPTYMQHVMTGGEGQRLYGHSLMVYERLPQSVIDEAKASCGSWVARSRSSIPGPPLIASTVHEEGCVGADSEDGKNILKYHEIQELGQNLNNAAHSAAPRLRRAATSPMLRPAQPPSSDEEDPENWFSQAPGSPISPGGVVGGSPPLDKVLEVAAVSPSDVHVVSAKSSPDAGSSSSGYSQSGTHGEKVPLMPQYSTPTLKREGDKAKDFEAELDRREIYAPKTICIISRWPFSSTFQEVLCELYSTVYLNGSSEIPIERFISNFVSEVPVPPQGKIQVQFKLCDRIISVARPPINTLPMADLDFRPLFHVLDHDNILRLHRALLTERKVVVHSRRTSLLAGVLEAALALMFPFSWPHVYIPVLPRPLTDFLHAPLPFLIGMHSNYLIEFGVREGHLPEELLHDLNYDNDEQNMDQRIMGNTLTGAFPFDDPEIVLIDLDRNNVSSHPNAYSLPALPEREERKLKKRLKKFANIFAPRHPTVQNVACIVPVVYNFQTRLSNVGVPPSPTGSQRRHHGSISQVRRGSGSVRSGRNTLQRPRLSFAGMRSGSDGYRGSASAVGSAMNSGRTSTDSDREYRPELSEHTSKVLTEFSSHSRPRSNMSIHVVQIEIDESITPMGKAQPSGPFGVSGPPKHTRRHSDIGVSQSPKSSPRRMSAVDGDLGVMLREREQDLFAAQKSPKKILGDLIESRRRSSIHSTSSTSSSNPNYHYDLPKFLDRGQLTTFSGEVPAPRTPAFSHKLGELNVSEIRAAFLRFFVSMFIKYRQYMVFADSRKPEDGYATTEKFRKQDFLNQHSERSRVFLSQFLESQMFAKFIEDRLRPSATNFEILFFDESIVAKINRSKMTISKRQTPFLTDPSGQFRQVYRCPKPQSNKEASDNMEYSTEHSSPKELVKYSTFPVLDEARYGSIRPVPSLIESVQDELLLVVTKNIGSQRIPVVTFVSAAHDPLTRGKLLLKRAGSKLAASSGFASKRFAPAESGITETEEVSEKTEKSAKDRPPGLRIPPKYSLREQVRTITPRSRMLLGKKLRLNQLQAVTRSTLILQSRYRARTARRAYLKTRKAATCFQRYTRGFIVRQKMHREQKCALIIQTCYRMSCARRRFLTLRSAATLIQSHVRALVRRRLYLSQKNSAIQIQSYVRGMQCRKTRIPALLRKRLLLFVRELVSLWEEWGTSLLYRSRLLTLCSEMYESDEGIRTRLGVFVMLRRETVKLKKFGGLGIYWGESKETGGGFPPLTSNEAARVKAANERAMVNEVKMMYRRLKWYLKPVAKSPIYVAFGVNPRGKRRKRTLLARLWMHDMVEIPEDQTDAAWTDISVKWKLHADTVLYLSQSTNRPPV